MYTVLTAFLLLVVISRYELIVISLVKPKPNAVWTKSFEPSSLISKLLTYLSYKNVSKPSFIKAIHPKNIFFDNSFKKESILKCFSQETQIIPC